MTQWVKRRWYRSLIPLVAAALCFVAIKYRLVDAVARIDSTPIGMLCGAIAGMLLGCLTLTLATICSMQMSTAVRAMLIVGGLRFAIQAHNDSTWVFSSVLPESLFLVVGAMLGELLRPSEGRRYLTGPSSRCLGTVNQSGDWCIVLMITLCAMALILTRVQLRAAKYLQEDALIAAIFVAFGFVTTLGLRYCQREFRRWPIHAIFIVMCTSLFMLLLPTLRTRMLIPRLAWPHIYWFGVCGAVAWYTMQFALCRWLVQCGWRWKSKRESLILLDEGQINFAATGRLRRYVAVQGWTSIAGVFVILWLIALIPNALQLVPNLTDARRSDIGLDDLRAGLGIVTRILCVMATVGVISVVTVTVVRGLIQQAAITAVCFMAIGVSWTMIIDPESFGRNQDTLIWATIALPAVLLARFMRWLTRSSKFDVGPRKRKRDPLAISSIMMLTLVVGVQIVLLQTVDWESRMIGIISATSFVGVYLTFVSLRRHLGKRTRTNLFAVAVPTVGAISLLTIGSYYEDPGPVSAFLGGSLFLSWLFGSIWLCLGWLQHVGWTSHTTK